MIARNLRKLRPIVMVAFVLGATTISATPAELSSGKTRDAISNTFVGNGGNAGDLELQMTLKQIRATLAILQQEEDPATLCVCPGAYRNYSLCEPIENLNDSQKNYCQKSLPTKAKELLEVLQPPGSIRWNWSDEPINVQEKAGLRQSDAVTDPHQKSITIHRDHFIKSRMSERVFLITHELAHLTKSGETYMRDDVAVGPFESRDGGRDLLNAYGSAIATYAYTNNIYSSDLHLNSRSKNYRLNWLLASYGNIQAHQDSTFSLKQMQDLSFGYRRQIYGPWGIFFDGGRYSGRDSRLATTTLTFSGFHLSAGLSRQFFPFDDPMTYWGQSFLMLQVGAEQISVKARVDDTFTSVEDDAKTFAGRVAIQYFFPLQSDFWLATSVAATNHRYELEQINVKSNGLQATYQLGVSYAF